MDESSFDMVEHPGAVEVHMGEFIVVTAEGASHFGYRSIAALLDRMRRALGLDAVFVAECIDGRSVVRSARALDDGASPADPLEESYGRTVVAQRPAQPRPAADPRKPALPQFCAVPVVGREGSEYGTLCACSVPFARWEGGDSSTEALRSLAHLIADTLDSSESGFAALGPLPHRAHDSTAA